MFNSYLFEATGKFGVSIEFSVAVVLRQRNLI